MRQAPATFQQQIVSASGTFPALPLDLTWRISRRFGLTARGAYFKATIKDFPAAGTDCTTTCSTAGMPNFTTGLGYSSIRTSLTRESSTSPGVVA